MMKAGKKERYAGLLRKHRIKMIARVMLRKCECERVEQKKLIGRKIGLAREDFGAFQLATATVF
jgi:hypothetical protein